MGDCPASWIACGAVEFAERERPLSVREVLLENPRRTSYGAMGMSKVKSNGSAALGIPAKGPVVSDLD